jgi:hypothetical protein
LPDLLPESWIEGVDAIAENDAWAVGYRVVDDVRRLLTLRWNGAAWQRVDALPSASGRLRSVVMLASDDVWAVGQIGSAKPLVIHWDGDAWTRSSLPSMSGRGQIFYGVDASAPDDIWAV